LRRFSVQVHAYHINIALHFSRSSFSIGLHHLGLDR